ASAVDGPVDGWRDKRIATLEPDSIVALDVVRGKDRYALKRTGKRWTLNGQTTDSAAVARYLDRLKTITAAGFATPREVDSTKARRGVRRLSVRGGRGVLLSLACDSTASGFLVHHLAGVGGEGATVYRMNTWDVDGVTPASRSLKKYPLGFAQFAVYFAGLTWRTSPSRGASRCSSPGLPTGRAAVLQLRAPRLQRLAAGRDQRQAHGKLDHGGGRGPRAGNGLPFPSAAGVLRHSGGPSVRGTGVREPLPPEAAVRSGGGGARRGLGQDGTGIREAVERLARDHRQAAPVRERGRGRERGG